METLAAPLVSAPRLVDPRVPVITDPRVPIPPPHAPKSHVADLLDIANQMTPDFAKHKCRHFLSALKKLAEMHSPKRVKKNVKNLIQGKAAEGLITI